MPIQAMQFQPLSFEQANPLITGAKAGSDLYKSFADTLSTELANRIQKSKAAVAPQMAQAELEQAQALPGLTRAQTSQASAQAGLTGQESKWYGDKAKAEIALQNAEAGLYGTNAEQKALMLRVLKQKMEAMQGQGGQGNQGAAPQGQGNMSTPSANSAFSNPNQGAASSANGANGASPSMGVQPSSPASQTQQGQGQAPAQQTQAKNSFYGVESPEPSVDDIANKMFFGMDTFTPKMENAKAQQQGQYGAYQKEVESANKAAQEAVDTSRLLSQYNYWMDQATLSGSVGGKLPAMGTASQSVNNIVNQLGLGAIEQVRNAMGSAKFAVADLNVALGMKPSREWNQGTRQFYTNFANAVNKRLQERAQFYTVAGSNPRLDLPKQDADALWTAYQNKYPISNKNGDKVLTQNLNHWQDFLSPRAVRSIKEKGTYSPISRSDITEENIKDTMKQTGLSREAVMKELEGLT